MNRPRLISVNGHTFQVLPGGQIQQVDSRAAQGQALQVAQNSPDFERLIRGLVGV